MRTPLLACRDDMQRLPVRHVNEHRLDSRTASGGGCCCAPREHRDAASVRALPIHRENRNVHRGFRYVQAQLIGYATLRPMAKHRKQQTNATARIFDPSEHPRLLTIPEVAEMTRAPESSVREWIRQKRLRSVKPGRRLLVPIWELEKMLQSTLTKDA